MRLQSHSPTGCRPPKNDKMKTAIYTESRTLPAGAHAIGQSAFGSRYVLYRPEPVCHHLGMHRRAASGYSCRNGGNKCRIAANKCRTGGNKCRIGENKCRIGVRGGAGWVGESGG